MDKRLVFCSGVCLILFLTPMLVNITAGQMATAMRLDNRLQLWIVDSAGKLWTTSKETANSSSNWTSWDLWNLPGNISTSQVAVAPLSDRRLQLWAIDEKGKLWSTWQMTTDINAGWASWDSWSLPGNASANDVGVAPLSDHRLQLWVMDGTGKIWTSTKQTVDPNSNWTSWYSWGVPGNSSAS